MNDDGGAVSIWHPSSGTPYGQYLKTQAFVSDIAGQAKSVSREVKAGFKATSASISEQTRQFVASNQELAREFGEGFDSVNCTLQWGFADVSEALRGIDASIDSLHADFNYNLGLLIEQARVHNQLLSELLSKLDAIHETLKSPLLTQAREYYNIGCDRLSKGLLDKALEAFLEAERKNDADFFTQFHIGNLYLYGIDEDDNVLDLDKAKKHLLLAARFAKAEIPVDAAFTGLAAAALLHASISIYARSGEADILGDPGKTTTSLEEARRLAAEAAKLNPKLPEAFFHLAKYCALLNEPEPAISSLEMAIALDRDYAVKVDVDHAFDPIRAQVFALLHRLAEARQTEAQAELEHAMKLLGEVGSWHPEDSRQLSSQFNRAENNLAAAKEHCAARTYFGSLEALRLLRAQASLLPDLKVRRISELKNQVVAGIQSVLKKRSSGGFQVGTEDEGREIGGLVSQAESQLALGSFESFQAALALVVEAKAKAVAIYERERRGNQAKRKFRGIQAKVAAGEVLLQKQQGLKSREFGSKRKSWIGLFIILFPVFYIGGRFAGSNYGLASGDPGLVLSLALGCWLILALINFPRNDGL